MASASSVNGHDHIHARDHTAKDGVLGGSRLVEKVQEGVVDGVDEELRSARVGLTSVSHGESSGLIAESGAVYITLVGNMIRIVHVLGSRNSSGIDPPALRVMTPLPGTLYCELGAGPPVPARLLLGSLEWGHPNWFMKLGMQRWK